MRRERYAILGDLLIAIDRAATHGDPRVTALAQRANLPHDRLVGYLADLREAGLLSPGASITPEGHEFLRKYREWREVLDRFGLAPTGAEPQGPSHPAMSFARRAGQG